MSPPPRFSSFQRLALLTTAATYFLILVGGLVRASGAGLGCPDWPRCFGAWIPPRSVAELPPQFDPSLFNPTLMWTEYLNRLLGVTIGFLILATVISAWRHHRREPRILWTMVAALLLTGFQGWLGGLVVANDLAPWIVTVHMIVALAIVQMLLYATVRAWSKGSGPPSPLLLALIVVTMIQIGLGTQVRGGVDIALDSTSARAAAIRPHSRARGPRPRARGPRPRARRRERRPPARLPAAAGTRAARARRGPPAASGRR
jgi:cytochrome c oxidase assembly protein subunit 15